MIIAIIVSLFAVVLVVYGLAAFTLVCHVWFKSLAAKFGYTIPF